MLIDFSVTNYRSFKNEVTLSLLSTTKASQIDKTFNLIPVEKGKYNLLTFSAIYGANASGKSNLIRAFVDFRDLLLSSHKLDLDDSIPAYEPFRLDDAYKNKPTKFETEFYLNHTRYFISIEFDEKKIINEELTYYPEGKKALLYKRNWEKPIKFGNCFKGDKKNIEKLLLPNQLFLSRAANLNHEQLIPIYRYFRDTYNLHSRMDSSSRPIHSTTIELRKNKDNANYKNIILGMLNAADLNIGDIELKENKNISDKLKFPRNLPENLKQKIIEDFKFTPLLGHMKYLNGIKTNQLEFFDLENEESTGTIKMYDIAGEIVQTLQDGTVLFIDEFNSGLHPALNKFIIELFLNPEINKKQAQLIIVTHDTCAFDLEKITRDQIWFTDKDSLGASVLYSLDEFDKNKIRKNSNFAKWYAEGRFRALPAIDFSKFKLE